MSRHIDQRHDRRAAIIPQGDCLQVDGNAAPSFFRVAVRRNSGQCRDQRRLAVVNVSSQSDDHVGPPRSQYSSAGIGDSPR